MPASINAWIRNKSPFEIERTDRWTRTNAAHDSIFYQITLLFDTKKNKSR